MGRVAGTVLGIAVVAVAAIWVAKTMLKPTQEKAERRAPVLTGEYAPRLEECRVLQDDELPEGVVPPQVDEDLLYIEVVVLFPAVDVVPHYEDHRLAEVNGVLKTSLTPIRATLEVAEEGTFVVLVFKTTQDFDSARLVRDEEVVIDRVALQ